MYQVAIAGRLLPKDGFPEFTNIWNGYKWYGNIQLSADRGEMGEISEMHTWNYLPESVFTDLKIPPFQELNK